MTTNSITRIPIEGGSGRVPTGAMQFQNDWPGIFIRGDDAIALMVGIRYLTEKLADYQDFEIGLILSNLSGIADIIDLDVKVRDSHA